MDTKPVTAIIVGGGHRSFIYADYALLHPDCLKIVGIADPDESKRKEAAEKYSIPAENCFCDAAELAEKPKLADVIINGTMDKDHVPTSIPLLKKGYDMLLEKPFAVTKDEMKAIADTVHENNNKVMICHVLRYADFYREIKKVVSSGEIGEVISIQLCEDVSYHHYATSYVRGKWANSDKCGTSMLLAKCCHDLDMMMWLMGNIKPLFVTSTGSQMYFNEKNAPRDAGKRCMVDCPHMDTCHLSAKRIYLDMPEKWDFYVWPELHHAQYNEKYEYLKNISPFGKCAFKCDNNVVDHQTVMIQFENGATGSHNLTGGCAYSQRITRVIGTKGEINGVFEDQKFTVSYINPTEKGDHTDKVVDLSADRSASIGHGGGDHALVEDFVNYIQNKPTSPSCTSIDDSVFGHMVVFCADESMEKGGVPIKTIL